MSMKHALSFCETTLSFESPPVKAKLPVPRNPQENTDMSKAFSSILNVAINPTPNIYKIPLGIDDSVQEGQYVETKSGKSVSFNNYYKKLPTDTINDYMVMVSGPTAPWAVVGETASVHLICQQDCKHGKFGL